MMMMAVNKQDQLSKYLETREAIKEKIRLRYRNDSTAAGGEQANKSNYGGSFFGPSAPSIAPRVLECFTGAGAAENNKKRPQAQRKPMSKIVEVVKAKSPAPAAVRPNPEKKKAMVDPIRKPRIVNPKPRETLKSSGNNQKLTARAEIRKAAPNPEMKRAVVDSIRKPKDVNPRPQETPKSVGNIQKLTARTEIGKAAVNKKSGDGDDVLPKRRRMVSRSDDEEEREGERALSMVRRMFNTRRFAGRDDRDFGAMESTFDEIGKEERRSAKMARKEDAEELRLLLLEEQREKEKRKRSSEAAASGKKRKFADCDE